MDPTMTPRDIQLRIRSGDSLADVIAVSGLPAHRVEAFAAPILAEREHITAMALSAAVRRRGESASARRLHQTVAESLLETGRDIDFVTWDSWRRSDGRWIVQGTSTHAGRDLTARFLFDPKGRFSVAENDQARLLVGDLPLSAPEDFEAETTERVEPHSSLAQSDLGEETTLGLSPGEGEDSLRSDIDLLYDMISTIDEDSVRIFRGLREPIHSRGIESQDQPSLLGMNPFNEAPPVDETPDPETGEAAPQTPKPRKGRKRASVPSWDDIIFGGQS